MTSSLGMREALWLTATLGLVAAPHAVRLPWWITLLGAMLIVWRLYLARWQLKMPHRVALLLIVTVTTVGIYLHYGTVFGRDAGVALLVVMVALKLLEMRTPRDATLLIFLNFFLIITNFLYSQTIPTALYMLACLWLITAGMIGISYGNAPGGLVHPLRLSGVLLGQSVPLMLALFVLFPRVQGPLWGMPADTLRGSTGLSDTMVPGSLSNLTRSEAVAFRAAFSSPMPELKRLYWRGPVLWDYDGRTWRAPPLVYAKPTYDTSSDPVLYTVTVEAHEKTWLFALDLPGLLPPRSVATSDFQIISSSPLTTRTRYEMTSFLDYKYGEDEEPSALERALRVPARFNPRTVALASRLKREHASDRAVMNALLQMFTRDGFSYTLSPPLLGEHSVDEFLFQTRSGFCEHYASAFAIVMRAAGIPARVVTGYLGGEPNPIGNYLIVRQADAHAWVEVWLSGEGWIRVDPTAAVSPARVERGISAMDAQDVLPLFMRDDHPLLRHLMLTWDSAANSWNQWVLGYTPERQLALLTRVGIDDATWRTLAALMLAAAGMIVGVFVLITLRRVRGRDPVNLAYLAFCNKLRRRGLARDASEGPLSYADRVICARPDLDAAVRRFMRLYVSLRYGSGAGDEAVADLKKMAATFKP